MGGLVSREVLVYVVVVLFACEVVSPVVGSKGSMLCSMRQLRLRVGLIYIYYDYNYSFWGTSQAGDHYCYCYFYVYYDYKETRAYDYNYKLPVASYGYKLQRRATLTGIAEAGRSKRPGSGCVS